MAQLELSSNLWARFPDASLPESSRWNLGPHEDTQKEKWGTRMQSDVYEDIYMYMRTSKQHLRLCFALSALPLVPPCVILCYFLWWSSQWSYLVELTKKKDICKLEKRVHFCLSFHYRSDLFTRIQTSFPPPASDLGEGGEEDAKGDPEGGEDGEEGELDGDARRAALVAVAAWSTERPDQICPILNHLTTSITLHTVTKQWKLVTGCLDGTAAKLSNSHCWCQIFTHPSVFPSSVRGCLDGTEPKVKGWGGIESAMSWSRISGNSSEYPTVTELEDFKTSGSKSVT